LDNKVTLIFNMQYTLLHEPIIKTLASQVTSTKLLIRVNNKLYCNGFR